MYLLGFSFLMTVDMDNNICTTVDETNITNTNIEFTFLDTFWSHGLFILLFLRVAMNLLTCFFFGSFTTAIIHEMVFCTYTEKGEIPRVRYKLIINFFIDKKDACFYYFFHNRVHRNLNADIINGTIERQFTYRPRRVFLVGKWKYFVAF